MFISALIPGRNIHLPSLPTVPGDEGVGEIVEIGNKVATLVPGDRVVITNRMLGTWRAYGIYTERDLAKISKKLTLPEAATLTIAPSTAYRLLKDFRQLRCGDTIIQSAANSPVGQSIIQFCKYWDVKTINIVASHCHYDFVKNYLLKIGGTAVVTLEEAEELSTFNTSLTRPVLALNCLGGRYEDVLLRLLERNGVIVYYGNAYSIAYSKRFLRCDAKFCRFNYGSWADSVDRVEKCHMFDRIVELMVVGKIRAPVYEKVELKDYIYAFRNTVHNEAFSTRNYIFDFTLDT